ncbi:Long-chain-fatty-acid--CoA ligase [Patulibacter medicamentivorans]|uniref:Acyl-CoA synthetase n=1 Tax=Patulibacter medicamentivorans TaxID=1097667 RepID=H0E6N4_9ACTN|nr:AMP-dependent synthetase/ligase [Patulibacter medicamentivorans]EHN10681.1 Long-chain-fatty-acid--CoA ligase [Patulibacter medicamentivorans]
MSIAPDAATDGEARQGAGPRTFCEAFQRTVAAYPDDPALQRWSGGPSLTWSEVGARVEQTAAALAGLGVRPGDTVAHLLSNRPEFHVLDLAVLHLGATPFSIYNTSPPEQIAHVLRNAGSRVIVTERALLAPVLAARGDAPEVTTVVSIDGGDGVLPFGELPADPRFDFDASWRAVAPEDLAVLIYTSGTTGPPKGVQLTHRSLIAAWRAASAAVPAMARRGHLISYLPHAHLADRFFAHYPAVLLGSSITCVEDPKTVVAALPEVRPSVWLAVPRIWEKLKTALEATLQGHEDPAVRQLAADGLAAGLARARGEQLDAGQVAAHERADQLLFSALRAKLGLDAADALVSGSAPIGADVLEFFAALGLEILEGYGMSECSAVISINAPGQTRIGTVGRPCPGVELQLADDGEILIRGEMLMVGYRGQPAQTAETLDPDGWLRTGDVGRLDADGYLRIVDRKKELIVNAAGKNMSPTNIENAIKARSPLIGQAVAIGDRRPYNTALLVLDPDAAAAYATQHDLADGSPAVLAADPDVLRLIQDAVERANATLSRVEQVKRWTLLAEEWQPGGPELTPTMKLKRKPIADRYAAQIDALYA